MEELQPHTPQLARRLLNIGALGLGWCLALSGVLINISTTSLAATDWTGNTGWSTLPIGVQVLCSAVSVVPAANLAQHYGRRPVFVGASLLAVVGSCIMIAAAYRQIFGLLVLGAFFQGPAFAVGNNFRFVSAEFVTGPGYSPEWRARAISLTVGCAVFASAIGPEAVRHVRDRLDKPYAGAYVLLTGIYAFQAVLLSLISYNWLSDMQAQAAKQSSSNPAPTLTDAKDLKLPTLKDQMHITVQPTENRGNGSENTDSPKTADVKENATVQRDIHSIGITNEQSNNGFPERAVVVIVQSSQKEDIQHAADTSQNDDPHWIRHALMRPEFFMPAVAASLSFCNMAGIMVATPVAMKEEHLTFDQSTYTIESHIVAMFLPGTLVGDLLAVIKSLAVVLPLFLRHALLLLPTANRHPSSLFPTTAPTTCLMIYGGLILIAGDIVTLQGRTFTHYMVTLSLIGFGWAWVYVSASSLVTAIFVREPRLRVAIQGGMDTLVVTASAGANILSGPLLRALAWQHFVYLNLAANIFLTVWCIAYHLLCMRHWNKTLH